MPTHRYLPTLRTTSDYTARPGLEPESAESKSAILPLDDQAICNLLNQRQGNEKIRTSIARVTASRAAFTPHPLRFLLHIEYSIANPNRSRSEGNRTSVCRSKVCRDNHYATLPFNLCHSSFRIPYSVFIIRFVWRERGESNSHLQIDILLS